jgi:transcriptional regulator with XRE-family HTH domain
VTVKEVINLLEGQVMNEFSEALKNARLKAKKTLRETGAYVNLSVGYMSDIEQGRKSAPDLETVRKLQDFLRVDNDALVILASEARTKRPTEIIQHIQNRPRLSELFMRARNLSDEQLEELIDKAANRK